MPRGDHDAPTAPWTTRGGASSRVGAIVLGLDLIVAGALALLYQLDIPAPPWSAVLSAALALVGLGIIVDARRGVNAGLVFIALILTVLLAAGSGPSVKFDSAFGDRTAHPTNTSQLDSEYRHAFGKMTLDLRDVDLPPGDTSVAVSISFGDVDVTLPPGLPVQVTGSTSFGHSNILGQDFDGRTAHEIRTPDYAGATRRLNIDLTTSFGSARVHR
jgi:hypothetical protein